MIISYNFYYASPGNASAVLRQRLLASDVRARLGLPRGRTISKLEGGDDVPDVIWRLDFSDMAAQDADMQARAASTEFETIRKGMRQLYRRFERPLYAPPGKHPLLPDCRAQQTLLLYGVYCDASACPALGDALCQIHAVEFISGGIDVPRWLCETGAAGLPQDVADALGRLPLRIERSAWRVADTG
jgi:hypothetical protein